MRANKLLFDTSALVEILKGSQKGEEANNLLLSDEVESLVASVSVAELTSKIRRASIDSKECLKGIYESSEILPLTLDVALNAGLIHAELKAKNGNISLADCIIMAHADEERAAVVTTDRHFLLYKNVKLL